VSYARRKPIGASRTFAIAIVALTHASLGYALVSGLAYTVIQKAPAGLKTFNVEEVQPPPPEQRATPRKVPESQPRVVAPPPLVRTDADPSAVGLEALPSVLTPAAAPAPPAPAYPVQSSPSPPAFEQVPPRSATGDLQGLFRVADYPIAALKRFEQGSVIVQLTVGVMGRVRACDVTSSSGSRALDNASCQILQSRASFTPARDSRGNLTTDTVRQEIRWVLG
jgi:periplasmic protein TonB